MADQLRDSSPWPDGLPYSVWAATIRGAACLNRVLVTITIGDEAPTWFNVTHVIFIPKGTMGNAGVYVARAFEFGS